MSRPGAAKLAGEPAHSGADEGAAGQPESLGILTVVLCKNITNLVQWVVQILIADDSVMQVLF